MTGVLEAYRAAGQEQVFRFWDRLDPEQRRRLLGQAREVDLLLVSRLASSLREAPDETPVLSPIDPIGPEAPDRAEARAAGEELFAGAVAGHRFAVRARRVGDRDRVAIRAREVERALGAALLSEHGARPRCRAMTAPGLPSQLEIMSSFQNDRGIG